MWAQAALDQKLGTLLRMHEAAFRESGNAALDIGRELWGGDFSTGEGGIFTRR
jgi:hypothetical protein